TGVHDSANNSVTGEGAQDFYFLGGDANADRVVNALDFNALASNFGKTNGSFAQGDFNFSGIVDPVDFTTMTARFGTTLPVPMPPATTYSSQVLSRHPIVYLPLNESSGTVAADSSGN